MCHTHVHSHCQMPDTRACQSDNCQHAHSTCILGQNKEGEYGVGWPGQVWPGREGIAPTLASVRLPRLCCTPWVVLVQVLAVLTVGTNCVVVAEEEGRVNLPQSPELAHSFSHRMPLSWCSPCLSHWLGSQLWAYTQRPGHGTGSCLSP